MKSTDRAAVRIFLSDQDKDEMCKGLFNIVSHNSSGAWWGGHKGPQPCALPTPHTQAPHLKSPPNHCVHLSLCSSIAWRWLRQSISVLRLQNNTQTHHMFTAHALLVNESLVIVWWGANFPQDKKRVGGKNQCVSKRTGEKLKTYLCS